MKKRVSWLCGTVLLAVFACGDGGVFSEGDPGTIVGSGAGGSDVTVSVQSGSGQVTSSSQASQSSSNALAASVGGGGGDVCAPNDGDPPCSACIRADCCETLTTCIEDAVCNCWIGCVTEGQPSIACAQQCGGTNTVWDTFLLCVTNECSAECG